MASCLFPATPSAKEPKASDTEGTGDTEDSDGYDRQADERR